MIHNCRKEQLSVNNYMDEESNLLVLEIAELLHDKESLPLYLRYTSQFSQSFLRDILKKVLSIPDEKIRKTRGALFTYLVENHGKHKHFRNGS